MTHSSAAPTKHKLTVAERHKARSEGAKKRWANYAKKRSGTTAKPAPTAGSTTSPATTTARQQGSGLTEYCQTQLRRLNSEIQRVQRRRLDGIGSVDEQAAMLRLLVGQRDLIQSELTARQAPPRVMTAGGAGQG
jgi:hypothetical protein